MFNGSFQEMASVLLSLKLAVSERIYSIATEMLIPQYMCSIEY
jgi:hypothetical protein